MAVCFPHGFNNVEKIFCLYILKTWKKKKEKKEEKGVDKKIIPLFTVQQQQQPYIYIVIVEGWIKK